MCVQELVGRSKCGTVDSDGRVVMPPMARLSMDTIEPTGLYLVEDGFQVYTPQPHSSHGATQPAIFTVGSCTTVCAGLLWLWLWLGLATFPPVCSFACKLFSLRPCP